jgi:hypothetical protein
MESFWFETEAKKKKKRTRDMGDSGLSAVKLGLHGQDVE